MKKISLRGISLSKFQHVFLMCLSAQMLSACAMLLNVSDDNDLPLLSSAPALHVISSFRAPTATFSSTDPSHSYFECQVDGVFAWTTCTSPFDLTTVVDRGFEGTFRTRSIGVGGDVGSETSQLFRRGIMPSGVNGNVNAVAYQSDGKKLLGGSFNVFKPETVDRLVAINPSGMAQSLFESFDGGSAYALAVQGDGKILVGGDFTSYAGNAAASDGIMRLNPDGTEDTAFSANAGVGLNGYVSSFAVQSDGKILVGGDFTSYNGNATVPNGILRLNDDGTEDTAFSANVGGGVDNGSISALAVQSDGKILVGGSFTSYAGNALAPDGILRLNPDGTEDTAFSLSAGAGFNGWVNAFAVQSDGKILVGGHFGSYAGNTAAPDRILRLNDDGTEDATFSANAGVGLNFSVNALAMQSDGKILVGGYFTSYAGNAAAPDRILRLNSDGTEDAIFSSNAGVGLNSGVYALAVQSDGKILVGGDFASYAGNAAASDSIMRLNGDGTEDTAFSANAGMEIYSEVYAFAIQSNGKSFAVGWFSLYGGNAAAPDRILRLNPDGTEDTAFSANAGVGFDGEVYALAVQSDGKILVGGYFTSYAGNATVPNRILRLNPDGTEDIAFSANAGVGFGGFSMIRALAVQSDGKILVGGAFTTYAGSAVPGCLLRLNDDGTEDTAFSANVGVGFDGEVRVLAVQSDGKILVGGYFTSYAGNAAAPDRILRLNDDGTVDADFSTNAGVGLDGGVHALAVQSDGKILVGGYFTSYAGNAAAPDHILRLNDDGTEDAIFSSNAGVGLNSGVYALAVQSDGKILVGGQFGSYAGNAAAPDGIVRLNGDGTEDFSFSSNNGVGFNYDVSALALQSDGKILVGGWFTKYGDDHFPNYTCELSSDGRFLW